MWKKGIKEGARDLHISAIIMVQQYILTVATKGLNMANKTNI